MWHVNLKSAPLYDCDMDAKRAAEGGPRERQTSDWSFKIFTRPLAKKNRLIVVIVNGPDRIVNYYNCDRKNTPPTASAGKSEKFE